MNTVRPTLPLVNLNRITEGNGGVFYVPPVRTPPRPGVLAAGHLQAVPYPGATNQEPAFFGYGSTLLVEGDDGIERAYQGNALIRMYTRPLHPETNVPLAPPPDRTAGVRARLFRATGRSGRPPGLRPQEVDPRQLLPVPVQAEWNILRPGTTYSQPPARIAQEGTRTGDSTEESVARILTGLKAAADEERAKREAAVRSVASTARKDGSGTEFTELTKLIKLAKHETERFNAPVPPKLVLGGVLPRVLPGNQAPPQTPVTERASQGAATRPDTENRPDDTMDIAPDVDSDVPPLRTPTDTTASDSGGSQAARPSTPYLRSAGPRLDDTTSQEDEMVQALVPLDSTGTRPAINIVAWKQANYIMGIFLRNGFQWGDDPVQRQFQLAGQTILGVKLKLFLRDNGKSADWEEWRRMVIHDWKTMFPNASEIPVRRILDDIRRNEIEREPMKGEGL